METANNTIITVKTTVNASMEKVWEAWNTPAHITQWCAASDEWHAPFAENDFREGGRSKTTMAAKDGSAGFDFEWTYTRINKHETIAYTMDDGRKATVLFQPVEHGVKITESFEAENTNPVALQQQGWQAILDRFKAYVEQH